MINQEINNLIYKIKTEITYNNIDVGNLCNNLCITENELIDYLVRPRNSISLYIEIMEEVKNEHNE